MATLRIVSTQEAAQLENPDMDQADSDKERAEKGRSLASAVSQIERTYGKSSKLFYDSYKRGRMFAISLNFDF